MDHATHLILPFSLVRSGLGMAFFAVADRAVFGFTVTFDCPLLELAKELMRPWPSSLVIVTQRGRKQQTSGAPLGNQSGGAINVGRIRLSHCSRLSDREVVLVDGAG
jgi:hypothetical protein